jgi:hypothetical protein
MAQSYSNVQIEHFKREAKKLCRASPLTHSQALNHIAYKNGFANWSLLMKHSEAQDVTEPDRPRSYRFIRTPDEMREALRVVQLGRFSRHSRFEEAKARTEDICERFISVRNAVSFAVEYVQCLLATPRFYVRSASPVYWEMHRWLPYALICTSAESAQYVLVNRKYKPVGHMGDNWVDYADFLHVTMQLTQDQLAHITRPESSEGYLFRDGSSPWRGRAEAAAYLEHLLLLQKTL